MKAELISTEGPYLEAIVKIANNEYCVMDELTLDAEHMPKSGELFKFGFSNMLDEGESWESMFNSNQKKKKGIEQIKGWKYRAHGEVIGINPVRVDCGLFVEEGVFHSNDPKVIGEFVSFTISRLGGYAI